MQVAEALGCVNAQFVPTPWHVVHDPLLCPTGAEWHVVQVAEALGCVNAQLVPTVAPWQVAHDPLL